MDSTYIPNLQLEIVLLLCVFACACDSVEEGSVRKRSNVPLAAMWSTNSVLKDVSSCFTGDASHDLPITGSKLNGSYPQHGQEE